jgi:hypothetical protein
MPFGSVEQMSGAYEAQVAAFDQVNRVECALLVDLRLVPPRNDPAFEGVVARYQEQLYAGFRHRRQIRSGAASALAHDGVRRRAALSCLSRRAGRGWLPADPARRPRAVGPKAALTRRRIRPVDRALVVAWRGPPGASDSKTSLRWPGDAVLAADP